MKRDPKIVRMYASRAWKKCRSDYKKYVGGLCENCMKQGIYTPGEIVHHLNHVTIDTVDNPEICFGFDNLELLCRKCHAEEHEDIYQSNPYLHKSQKRYKVDEFGRVISPHDPRK